MFYSVKVVVLGQKLLYSGKVVLFGQGGFFEQSGFFIPGIMVVFGQNWL